MQSVTHSVTQPLLILLINVYDIACNAENC
uniref:Uncharacterized protein n=1 Tax=viral metagenome TaxID=1070528 RepID=A0A6C0HLR0_9ZZZZ